MVLYMIARRWVDVDVDMDMDIDMGRGGATLLINGGRMYV